MRAHLALALAIGLALAARDAVAFDVGLNYPWHQVNGEHFYGRLFGEMTDPQRAEIRAHFQDMQQVGIRSLRIWLFADGWRWPERVNGRFQPLPGAFLADLRWFVREAHARGIRVQPSIWDFYINRTRREYLTDPAALPDLARNVVKPLVAALANEPGIRSWDVINEPEWMIDFGRGANVADLRDGHSSQGFALDPALRSQAPLRASARRGRGFEPGPPHAFAPIRAWIQGMVDAVHAGGGRATIGSAGTQWVGRWRGMGLDEYQVHYYPKAAWGFLGNAQFRLLPSVKKLGLDRPCVLGEFPPNLKHTELPTVLSIIRDHGYSGAWAWEYFGDGFPENLAHPFSYRARRLEFKAFTGAAPLAPARSGAGEHSEGSRAQPGLE